MVRVAKVRAACAKSLTISIGVLCTAAACGRAPQSDRPGRLELTTSVVDLGSVYVGTRISDGFSVVARNEVLQEIGYSRTGSPAFDVHMEAPDYVVRPGDLVSFTVTFAPTFVGVAEAEIVVDAHGAEESVAVRLTGEGVAPPDCDDEEPCTSDEFDFELGCRHAWTDDACDDEDACTDNDRCALGICTGTPRACDAGS